MSDEAVLDELERSLAAVARHLADRATASDLAERCGFELPPASWALLEHLDDHGPLRVSDIAACHGVDVSSITPRLKRLEQAGLVTRERDRIDARSFLISIAPEGTRALESVHSARREILHQALGGTDPALVAGAATVLRRLAGHLAQESHSPDRTRTVGTHSLRGEPRM